MQLTYAFINTFDSTMSNTATTPRPCPRAPATSLTFESVYADTAGFVWRAARRFGVEGAALEDLCQEVFVAVHNGLSEFAGLGSVKTWVFGILRNSVRMYRRGLARKEPPGRIRWSVSDAEEVGSQDKSPYELVSSAQALRIAHDILESLDEDKREAFVLVELEQWSIVDAAEALGVNVNTVSTRLRAARKEFAQAANRIRIRDSSRNRDTWRSE
jgi:RNA polymerase sigma-70 factor (ECF subfamily)